MVSPRPRRLGSKALAVALAGVLHLGGITWASTPIEGPASAALNELIREHLTDRRIPGASIAIIEAGHQVRTAAYGTAVLQHGVPARIDTVYEIGSLSKQFTAAAVLMLRDEGKLDLEDPIGRYVVSAPEAWSGITIRHLLTHTAGLIREGEEFASLRGQGRRHGSKEAMLESAMADGLQGDPGERFSYGNEGYFLATLVVERASGLSFRDFMRERIFEPLGMRQTLFQDELRIIPNEARHYSLEVGEWVNLRRDAIEEAAGGWGMRSSIPDLVRWDRALREVALLSAEAHREMFEPVTLDDGASFRYGLGWWLPERNGIAYQYHRGVTGSEILRIPSLDLTVIVLTNLGRSGSAGGNEADPWGLADAIAGLLIPEFVLEPGDLPLSGQELASLDDLGERSMQSAATETEAGDPSPGSESTLPRIGLVLSGGGALGAAHVGVLKVLEELRIPVHFVAGTSMGALVGGLYSTGVSPKELEGILEVTDWRDVLDDHPPRRHLPYRRKVDDQTFLAGFEAGFNNGSFQTPPGLISGQKIGFALLVMALRAAGVDDFDQLPIPFRAVATDLENGEMVVLGQGDLAQAMRASMSVPGIFSPIELDDRLLVDGGLVRNLPVDVALSMGADVIIAVDVGESLRSRDELTSITKVTGQMLGMQMRSGVDEQAAMADVLIRPDLDGYGNTQFDRSLEMVPLGESAARRELASLQRFSVSEAEYQDHISTIRRPRPLVDARVRSVQLTASSTADPHFVMRHMKTRPGDKLDVERIQQDLERLYETGDFERIDLRLTRADTEDSFDLNIEAIDKSWGPNYLRFGLNLFADFEGESSFDALASYTMTQLNRRRGELKIQAQVGENTSLLGELYQPFSMDQTWFAALSVQGATSTTLVPVEGGVLASYQVDLLGMGLDLGLQLGRFAELRLGLTRGMIDANPQGDPVSSGESGFLSATRSHYGGLTFTAIVDQFDNMNFPQDGYFAVADYFSARESMGSDVDYEHLVGFFGRAMTKGRHTLLLLSNLYSALGSTSPEIYSLGGLFKLSGVPADSITGQYGGNLSLLYLNRVAELPTGLGNGVYAGFSFEGGNLWDEKNQISFDDLRYAGSLFVGADTILGPLYLAKGFSEGDHAFYFFMGRTF